MSRLNYPAIHRTRYEQIKPFIDFKMPTKRVGYKKENGKQGFKTVLNVDELTPYQKRKIKKYSDTLEPYLGKQSFPYSPKSKKEKRVLANATKIPLKGLKKYPLDVPAGVNPKVKIDGDLIKISHDLGTSFKLYFDQNQLRKNPEQYLTNLFKSNGLNSKTVFVALCGEHLANVPITGVDEFVRLISTWLETYDKSNVKQGREWENWLLGCEVNSFKTTKGRDAYLNKRKIQTQDAQTRMKYAKQTIQRAKGKKKNRKRK